jgi:hypothetical protein
MEEERFERITDSRVLHYIAAFFLESPPVRS